MVYDPELEELDRPVVKKLLRIESFEKKPMFYQKQGGRKIPYMRVSNNHCSRCYNQASKKAIYDVGGAQLVERYCEICVQKI